MRHLIDPADFTLEETLSLMDLADRIHDDPAAYKDVAARKRLATLFYEPSTRTRLSFEAAMLNLGGQVLGFPDAGVSSASKGETVADTIRVISCVADIAAMRHPKEGAPLRASRYSRIPVINAGDGGHSHPTQTPAGIPFCTCAGDQCRRWWARASQPDDDRPHDDPPAQGTPGSSDHRLLRRPQVWPHGAQPDQEPVPSAGHEVCAHLTRGAARAGLHHQRDPRA